MKKIILSFLLVGRLLSSEAQYWQATNLTNVTYLPISCTESHGGELYATVATGFSGDMYQLKSNQTAWDKITLSNIAYPKFLKSAQTRLYLTSVVSGVRSMVYYTYDGGKTLKVDTAGLPHPNAPSSPEVLLIYGIQYYQGKVILNGGSSGYFIKDTSASKWTNINVVTSLNGGIDPLTCYNSTLYAYDNTGTHTLYKSTDFGNNWSVVNTNLPSDYSTNLLVADQTNGRIYSFGAWSNSTLFGLRYSDDGGTTWTLHDLSAFLGKNAGNTAQLIKSIYTEGSVLYLGLENNRNNSSPDLIASSTGLNGLSYDTLGFPTNGASSLYPAYILKHNNKIVVSLVTTDVFIKGAPSSAIQPIVNHDIQLYPNPVHDLLNLSGSTMRWVEEVIITDATGRTILKEQVNSNNKLQISTLDLGTGIYQIQLKGLEKTVNFRFVKS